MIANLQQNPIVRHTLNRYRKDWRFGAAVILILLGYMPVSLTIVYGLFLVLAVFAAIVGGTIGIIFSAYADEAASAEQWAALLEFFEEFIGQSFDSLTWFGVLGELYEVANSFLTNGMPSIATGIFYATVLFMLLLITFFAPVMTSAAISGERQRQTLEILVISLLSTRQILWGKLVSAWPYLLSPIVALWTLFLVCFALRGVDLIEIAIALLLLIVTSLALTTLGLFTSTLTKTITGSLMLAYGLFLPGLFLLPALLMSVISVVLGAIDPSWLDGWLSFYGWGLVSCLNPFSAGAISAAGYNEMGAIFFSSERFGLSGATYFYPMPWLVFVTLYGGLTWLFFRLAVWRLERLRHQ